MSRIRWRASRVGLALGITFAIGRIDDVSETLAGEGVSSAELVEQAPTAGEAVIALDGTILDEAQIDAARAALAEELPEDGAAS